MVIQDLQGSIGKQNMAPKRLKKCRTSQTSNSVNADELSQLPEAILRHILFFLPVQDAVRVSALSKSWLQVWKSLPVFSFSLLQDQVGGGMPGFVDRVNRSLSQLQNQKAIIENFTLNMGHYDEEFASNVDHWLFLVMRNYVKELSINISSSSYTLPQAIFASKSLVKLTLEGCKFPATLVCSDTKQEFNCLKELYLVNVVANEDQIQNLVNCFRFMEKLTLRLRTGMQCLVLDNFPKLQYVAVAAKILTIDAANLHTLILCGPHGLHASTSTVNIKQLWCILSPRIVDVDNLLQDLVSNFPLLETLYLSLSYNGRFRVQHCHLKTLHLYGRFHDPMEVELDTPKLCKFYCNGSVFPSLHVTSTSVKECETFELHIRGVTFAILDGSHIHRLGSCLQNFNPNIEVKLHNLCTENLLTLAQLQKQEVIPRSSNVRKLVLISIAASSDYTSFLDGLLWTCHPNTLVIKECSFNGDNFIKFLFRELLGRQGTPTCCEDDLPSRCWRHFLKGVKAEFYLRVCGHQKPMHVRSSNLARTLDMCDTEKKVKFRFEWSEGPLCQ